MTRRGSPCVATSFRVPLSPFGAGVRDIDLRELRGQSWRFSHTLYWALSRSGAVGAQVKALREALDLTGLRLRS